MDGKGFDNICPAHQNPDTKKSRYDITNNLQIYLDLGTLCISYKFVRRFLTAITAALRKMNELNNDEPETIET
jgi:hypothetical protein